jgi:signal peptidase I
MPSSYGILPYPGDIIKFEQSFLQPTNDVFPIYIVTGVETATNCELTFWKLTVNVYRSRTINDVEEQLEDSYVFFDYTKKIYTVPQSTFLTRMLIKNEEIKDRLNNLFDQNSGFYFI